MSTRVVVFAGPSLTTSARASKYIQGMELRPPAAKGDLYGAAQAGAAVIGLIDGYFRDVPATQHKEILWALDKGAAVFGAASIGALRAAELWPFGMVGVGCIFRDFAEGRLCRDDEVAVEHGPEALGFVSTSEALVNIRYGLRQAVLEGKLLEGTAEACIQIAAEMFYPDRTLEKTLRQYNLQYPKVPIPASVIDCLLTNRRDQKAADAEELLREISILPISTLSHPRPRQITDTMYFSAFRRQMDNPFLRDLL